MAIRTRVLGSLQATIASGVTTSLYIVPAVTTAIVKHWYLKQDSGQAATLLMGIRGPGLFDWVYQYSGVPSGALVGPGLTYIVLRPGEELIVLVAPAAGAPAHTGSRASGSQFPGVAFS